MIERINKWPSLRVQWSILTYTHSCCKGFSPKIVKARDCECISEVGNFGQKVLSL